MAGFTLEDLGERVTWRAVLNFCKHAGPGTALYRVASGPDGAWSLEAQLMAMVADVLNVANYQRGGGKGKRPKPIQRPGVKETGTKFGGGVGVPLDEFNDFWARGQ